MFQFRQPEDFCISRSSEPGVLEVRAVSSGETRWTFRLDVAATYAERFVNPEAFAIDGRIGRWGELHLIAHVRDAARPRLLPPRELTLDGPSLYRARPGADRHALEGNRQVIYGGERCDVKDETATSLALRDGRTIAKSDAFAGPFIRMVTYRDWSIRIVQELDDHVLAVVAGSAGKTLGWSTGVTGATEQLGYRWFERSELDNIEPSARRDPCEVCARVTGGHAAGLNLIELDRGEDMDRRVVECYACLTTWTVQQLDREPWSWTVAARRERDGKPGIEIVALAPSPDRVHEPGAVFRGDHRSPFQPDRDISAFLAPNLEVELAGVGTFAVDDESELAIVLVAGRDETDPALVQAGFVPEPWREVDKYNLVSEGVLHRLTIDKRDARLCGPHLRLVRVGDAIVRVAARGGDQLLIVAEGRSLASRLGFGWGATHGQRIGYSWIPAAEVEPLR